ncbi:competence protein, partial [Bacteroides ovatus]
GYDGHLEELTRIFSFSYVILDASLSEYRRHLLESECKQSGLRFISLSDEGSVRFLL